MTDQEPGELPPELIEELLKRDEGQESFRGIHRSSVRGGLPKSSTEGFIDLFTVKKKRKEVKNEESAQVANGNSES